MEHILRFKYLNHKGILRTRNVHPIALEYLYDPGFGYKPGWFLRCYDIDKAANRSFALSNIVKEENTSSNNFSLKLI